MHAPLSQDAPPTTPLAEQPAQTKSITLTYMQLLQVIGLAFVAGLALSGLLVFLLSKPDPAPIVLHPPPTPAPTATPLPTPTPSPVTVFVSGGVAAPGVYRLAWDARVGDALAAAGGLVDGVDGARVNQAERLFDGAQVHVPDGSAEQAEESVAAGGPPPGISGTAVDTGAPVSASGSGGNGLVNLNTASAEGLMALPGIGPSKAAAIIANRPYDGVDDLDRVPGFGPKTVDQLRELVTTR